jgi:hypothetical protein
MKLSAKDLPALILIVAVIGLCLLFDLVDFDLSHMLGNAAIAVVAATIGVLLGRNSSKANDWADEWVERAKAAERKLREHGISPPR